MQEYPFYLQRLVRGHVLSLPIAATLLSSFLVTASAQDADEDVYELSPFQVSTDRDVGYLSTNSTSGTSLNVELKDLPMTVQVVNQEIITDLAASNLNESLAYTSGVFTSDNSASSAQTRGGPVGNDRSISSASGGRFGNRLFIRGLSVPYQNRLGFRNGGLVVTPNSTVALGGLFDSVNIERIEVVKGPNSLLYGVGVLTGIANVIPERPLPEQRFDVSLRVGSEEFLRGSLEATGPVGSESIPGELNWRFAAAYEDRGAYVDFGSSRTEYYVGQLEYKPNDWFSIFLEYQHGKEREEGIGSRWIIDDVDDANDTEFRNEFEEGYNWARHVGTIAGLRPIIADSFAQVDTIGQQPGSQQGWLLADTTFEGGARDRETYRITGPDTFAERVESNFLADLTLTPIKDLSINIGAFITSQETEELILRIGSSDLNSIGTFLFDAQNDDQLGAIYESGHLYGVQMSQTIRDLFQLDFIVDPEKHPGDWVLPAVTDDIKLTEYWWERDKTKADSQQYRVKAVYKLGHDLFGKRVEHTFLAGYSYIEDDVDFSDGNTNRGNVRANVPSGDPVGNSYNDDGLYWRAIDNFEPIYFDGRNDGVDGHNVVRAGDAYQNQVITQQGLYGVYQGKFFDDKLDIIFGMRQDTYNARQLTYKRANISDADLIASADNDVMFSADSDAVRLLPAPGTSVGNMNTDQMALSAELLALRTENSSYIESHYRSFYESGRQGYFGLAERGAAPDAIYGIVPGSEFDIFEKDVEATTGTFGLNYALTDALTIYGVYSEGISPNTALRDGSGEIIPAEETENREVGFKFDFQNTPIGRISGTINYYEIDRSNAIWNTVIAPTPSRWVDAGLSEKRANNWTLPTFDPTRPVVHTIDLDYMTAFFGEVFGIDPDALAFAQEGTGVTQSVSLSDLDPSIPILERLQIIRDVQTNTRFPDGFATFKLDGQPYSGNVSFSSVGLRADGIDDLQPITLLDPATGEFVTKEVSNFAIIYSAFMNRNLDPRKTPLVSPIAPIQYNSERQAQPNIKNNPDQRSGGLVTFDETITGSEFEIFWTPTSNLQVVMNYSHTEREANNDFAYSDYESIVGSEVTFIAPFGELYREYGWANAEMQGAWVDQAAYQAAVSSGDGLVALADLDAEVIATENIDETIPISEFAARNAAGEIFLFVDKFGNFINEANNPRPSDYTRGLEGVSLNFNPEDEFAMRVRYKFDADNGRLDGLALLAGFRYIGPSKTSAAFNSVSPLNELTLTPDVAERTIFDVGASYSFTWEKVRFRLQLNVNNLFAETYEVTYRTFETRNPLTGELATKRTERFYSPTTYRLGLSASF